MLSLLNFDDRFFFFLEEAAIELGKQKDLVRKAVSWANTKEHPGVEGEAKRLLSWLIINSKSVLK